MLTFSLLLGFVDLPMSSLLSSRSSLAQRYLPAGKHSSAEHCRVFMLLFLHAFLEELDHDIRIPKLLTHESKPQHTGFGAPRQLKYWF
jgi:hypothetical protein